MKSILIFAFLIMGIYPHTYAQNTKLQSGEIVWRQVSESDFKTDGNGKKALPLKKKLRLGKKNDAKILGLYFKVYGKGSLRVFVIDQNNQNVISRRVRVSTRGAEQIVGVAFDNLHLKEGMRLRLTLESHQNNHLDLTEIAATLSGDSGYHNHLSGENDEMIKSCEARISQLEDKLRGGEGKNKEDTIQFLGFHGRDCDWNFKAGQKPTRLSGSVIVDGELCLRRSKNISSNIQSVLLKSKGQETCTNIQETNFLNLCTSLSEDQVSGLVLPSISLFRSINDTEVIASVDLSQKGQSCQNLAKDLKRKKTNFGALRIDDGSPIEVFTTDYFNSEKVLNICDQISSTKNFSEYSDIVIYGTDTPSIESVILKKSLHNGTWNCKEFISEVHNQGMDLKGIEIGGKFKDIRDIAHTNKNEISKLCQQVIETGDYVDSYAHQLTLYGEISSGEREIITLELKDDESLSQRCFDVSNISVSYNVSRAVLDGVSYNLNGLDMKNSADEVWNSRYFENTAKKYRDLMQKQKLSLKDRCVEGIKKGRF